MTTPTEAEVREAVTDEQLVAIWRTYEFSNEYGTIRMARDMETLKRRIEQDATALQSAQADTARLEWMQAQSEPGFGWAVRQLKITGGGGLYQLIKFAHGDKTLCPEVRAAIDAAMSSDKKGAGT